MFQYVINLRIVNRICLKDEFFAAYQIIFALTNDVFSKILIKSYVHSMYTYNVHLIVFVFNLFITIFTTNHMHGVYTCNVYNKIANR